MNRQVLLGRLQRFVVSLEGSLAHNVRGVASTLHHATLCSILCLVIVHTLSPLESNIRSVVFRDSSAIVHFSLVRRTQTLEELLQPHNFIWCPIRIILTKLRPNSGEGSLRRRGRSHGCSQSFWCNQGFWMSNHLWSCANRWRWQQRWSTSHAFLDGLKVVVELSPRVCVKRFVCRCT